MNIARNFYAIWDLDNCLSNDERRIRLINWEHDHGPERYEAYHAHCAADRVANLVVFQAVSQLARPVFFTARPEKVRTQTTAWVHYELGVKTPLIFMRADADSRGSVIVKQDMFHRYSAECEQPCLAAFDDREDIVDMYRNHGVNAALLSVHDTCAVTPPKLIYPLAFPNPKELTK